MKYTIKKLGGKQFYPYSDVIRELKKRWNIDRLKNGQRIIWIMGMKRIFLDGFTADDIFRVFDQAMIKGKWPAKTPFFRRVHDLLLLERKPEKTVTINEGFQSLASIL